MCDRLWQAVNDLPASNRRSVLTMLGVGAATAIGGAAGAPPATAATTATAVPRSQRRTRTSVTLLGTSGGPAILSNERAGISTAITYDGKIYVVDLGLGALRRLAEVTLDTAAGAANSLNEVRGIFFTHLHSDHITDWSATWLTGALQRIGAGPDPIHVFGPGDRGTLPRVFPPSRPAPPVVNPDSPTPGTVEMTEHLRSAYASDLNDRARDTNFAGPDSLFRVRDVDLAGIWDIDPAGKPPRLTAPIEVWRDGDVRITATLVDHHPTAPAFGYRFDTPDGSVVVSGDTTVSQNLIDLAGGADYLVHEVIDPDFVARLALNFPPEVAPALVAHLLESHTTIEQVGRDVAQPAGVKNLVLSHLVPGNNPKTAWLKAKQGFSGRLIVGEDLMRLPVG